MAKVVPTFEQRLEAANNRLRAFAPPHPSHYAGLAVWLHHGWLGGPAAEAELREWAERQARRWREFLAGDAR